MKASEIFGGMKVIAVAHDMHTLTIGDVYTVDDTVDMSDRQGPYVLVGLKSVDGNSVGGRVSPLSIEPLTPEMAEIIEQSGEALRKLKAEDAGPYGKYLDKVMKELEVVKVNRYRFEIHGGPTYREMCARANIKPAIYKNDRHDLGVSASSYHAVYAWLIVHGYIPMPVTTV